MNYTRLLLAALVATLVDMVYGFAIYGVALEREVQMNAGVYRDINAVNANLPWLIVGLLITMTAASYVYAQLVAHGGGSLLKGLSFGIALGFFCVGYVAIGNYVVMELGRRLTAFMAAAQLLEWAIVGMAIGAFYKPATDHVQQH